MKLRTVVAASLTVACLVSASIGLTDAAVAAPREVQVLLQGRQLDDLKSVLEVVNGTLTHELPIVSGIGGIVLDTQLEALRAHPAVERMIEDFNPPDDPEPRECPVAGALQIQNTPEGFDWRVHNFAPNATEVSSVVLDTGSPDLVITAVTLDGVSLPLEDAAARPAVSLTTKRLTLPSGTSDLKVRLAPAGATLDQNQLTVEIVTPTCTERLVPAYPDNSNDYYYTRALSADRLHAQGITGKGVTVAVIDSGLWEVAPLQQDTAGKPRITERFDALQDRVSNALRDASGHGSHMASILANSGTATGSTAPSYKGVAPDVQLVPVRVFDASGNGDFLDILRGIQWVLANHERLGIRIMNLSLAAVPRFPYWDDPINQAVLKAWQANILVVAAAGNEGPDWGTIGSPGNNPYVLTVGALTDSWTATDLRDDYIPDFSSRGPTDVGHIKPDVVAPGGHMTGLVPPDSTMATDNPNWFLDSGEFVSTGSSQAAAAVAGVAALLLQLDSSLTNDELKCLITSSARPAINRNGQLSYSPFTQGAGYVDAARAVTLGRRDCRDPVMDINAAVLGIEKLYGPAEADDNGDPTLPGAANLISTERPARGFSTERVWGVKAHMDRLDLQAGELPQAPDVPTNWALEYERERLQMQSIRSIPPRKNTPSEQFPPPQSH